LQIKAALNSFFKLMSVANIQKNRCVLQKQIPLQGSAGGDGIVIQIGNACLPENFFIEISISCIRS
jgi:hypothetical protein